MPETVIWVSVAFGMPNREIWVLRTLMDLDECLEDELRERLS